MQQGEPLDPLLFCLISHQICTQLKTDLCLFYLDDITFGGKLEDVLYNLDLVEREGEDLGLLPNHQKSEVTCADHVTRGTIMCTLLGAHGIASNDATILGSSVGNNSSFST